MRNKKRFLITGSRKGIGRNLAEFYLEKGHAVVGCSRSETDLDDERYTHYCLDVSDEKAVKKMFISIRKKYSGLDVLINNAGIASMNHFLLTPYETVQKMFQTNFFGCFLCSREAAKLMQKNRFGRIVNLSTVAVPLNLEGESIYSASKSSIEQFTKIIAKELGDMGITVNAVGPTPIKTDLIKGVSDDKIEDLLEEQAINRYGKAEDVINVIDFFVSERSDFITGQTIYLGGVFR